MAAHNRFEVSLPPFYNLMGKENYRTSVGGGGTLECSLCRFKAPFDHLTSSLPPMRFSGPVYIRGSNVENFVVLGSECTICKAIVCANPQCSVFFTNWFCQGCFQVNSSKFPAEVRASVPASKPLAEEDSTDK
ncbi:unnamed protein product [Cyprideis torosa]|uniref:Cysteine-rich DPF motif domain-containing protein 1 n=1 Tax=Cyprideis torosa TaxID=163714 RepID=A0A7R8ZSG7_9CRUS|nr:unnamed protein product [Cyprideis torosa]CAG0895998.1 unnamed protein product [Cyprideis torosa]